MIYTVTLNPSIDFIVRINKVEIGEVNRMESDDKFAGGKGINVSRILQRLGVDNTATGFIGGFTGRFVTDGLDAEGIKTKFVAVDQDTRINVKIIFAGSAPSNLGNKVYNKLIPLVRETGAQVVCDFEGQTLLDSLAYQPLLVKPNNHELEAIFNVKLNGLADVEKYAREILVKGAQNVIISMAGDGALLVTPEAAYFAKPIKGTVKNSVGAGDSMVAGFTGEFVKSGDPIEALKWGVACGTSTAFSDDLATIEFIKETYNKVEVEKL